MTCHKKQQGHCPSLSLGVKSKELYSTFRPLTGLDFNTLQIPAPTVASKTKAVIPTDMMAPDGVIGM